MFKGTQAKLEKKSLIAGSVAVAAVDNLSWFVLSSLLFCCSVFLTAQNSPLVSVAAAIPLASLLPPSLSSHSGFETN